MKTPAVVISEPENFRAIERMLGGSKLYAGPGSLWLVHDGRAISVNIDDVITRLTEREPRITITKKGRAALAEGKS